MFEPFFYRLREYGMPVSPTAFLQLQKALSAGLISSLGDFYVVARALMVKRERHFDLNDQLFANYFEGKEIDASIANELTEELKAALQEWLKDPQFLESLSDEEKAKLQGMTPDEVVDYFLQRLKDQTEAHSGGSRWIGTGGTSPVGHGGYHPGGMRVGGTSMRGSAIKVAMDRRYVDYSDDSPLSARQLGEALRAVRHLAPVGPKDELDVDKTIYQTVKQAGEIELVFDRRLRDKLSVFLFIDNGGWSMSRYIDRTRDLFRQARHTFKELKTYFFHNCIYDVVWEDPQRWHRPIDLEEVLKADSDTRIIVVGDASMASYELLHPMGALDIVTEQRRAGLDSLKDMADRFPNSVWINPIRRSQWPRTRGRNTLRMIKDVFPMVDLTLTGIEQAVELLKN